MLNVQAVQILNLLPEVTILPSLVTRRYKFYKFLGDHKLVTRSNVHVTLRLEACCSKSSSCLFGTHTSSASIDIMYSTCYVTSQGLVIFGVHWSTASTDITHFIFHVTSKKCNCEVLNYIMSWRFSLYITTLKSLLALGIATLEM